MTRVLILGGARSGKSHAAEAMLAEAGLAAAGRAADAGVDRGVDPPVDPPVDYVATGASPGPDDLEWAERVRLHQARRPAHWRTVETLELTAVLADDAGPPALIECISTWLAAVMDEIGFWAGALDVEATLEQRVDRLVEAWAASRRPVIAVSTEVGLGVVPATSSGRRYRDELGRLNMRLAASAEEVWFVVAGLRQRLK